MENEATIAGGESLKKSTFLVYPSWAEYSHKWPDLPEMFLCPEKWDVDDMPRLKAIGYSVSPNDHNFFDGPNGGGIIEVFRPIMRWFPNVLFTREVALSSPKGFNIFPDPYEIYVMAPRIWSHHRILDDKPIPYAPSPHCSVEQLPEEVADCYVALSVSKPDIFDDSEFTKGFPSMHIEIERLKETPENARETFAKVDDPRLKWVWYSVRPHGAKPCAWVAAMIYLGLRLSDVTRNNAKDMHIFTAEFVPGAPFPTAQLWTNRKGKEIIVTADDW